MVKIGVTYQWLIALVASKVHLRKGGWQRYEE